MDKQQIEPRSRRLDRQLRATGLNVFSPAPGRIYGADGLPVTTPGQPVKVVTDYFKGLQRGPELITVPLSDFGVDPGAERELTGEVIDGYPAWRVKSATGASYQAPFSLAAADLAKPGTYEVKILCRRDVGTSFDFYLFGTTLYSIDAPEEWKWVSFTMYVAANGGHIELRSQSHIQVAAISIRQILGLSLKQPTIESAGELAQASPNSLRNQMKDTEAWEGVWALHSATLSQVAETGPAGSTVYEVSYSAADNMARTLSMSDDPGGETWTGSIWLRAGSATSVRLVILGSSAGLGLKTVTCHLTNEWQRYEVTSTFNGTGDFARMRLVASEAGTIYASSPQIEEGSVATPFQKVKNELAASMPLVRTLSLDGQDDGYVFNLPDRSADMYAGFAIKTNDPQGLLLSGATSGGYHLLVFMENVATAANSGGGNLTVVFDGVARPGITRGELYDLISDGRWHVVELHGLDLTSSAWDFVYLSGYTGWEVGGHLSGFIIGHNPGPQGRAVAHRWLKQRIREVA